MKVLHLFSDWKWTGPAEPALELAGALLARGLDVRFACSPLPFDARDAVEKRARERGIEPITRFALRKHFCVLQNFRDAAALAGYLRAEEIDVVHAHRLQDHWVAAMAIRRCGRRVRLVRTCYDGVPQRKSLRNRLLYRSRTDLLIDVSREAYQADGSAFRLNRRIVYIPPAVDTNRFDRAKVEGNLRAELGIPPDAMVFGIVARIQEHRRFEILLEAFRRISRKYDKGRLMVVGRGTKMDAVAVRPAKRLGLDGLVHFAGYRKDDYVQALATFDVQVMMVPGSDGTCRALLQGMSMGIPQIVSPVGILPELVHDGVNGLLASEVRAGDFAEAFARFLRDPRMIRKYGEASRRLALERYDLRSQAKRVEAEYLRILARDLKEENAR